MITTTYLVEKGSLGDLKRFQKVHYAGGRYFLQAPQGAIEEISEEEFNLMYKKTKENVQ